MKEPETATAQQKALKNDFKALKRCDLAGETGKNGKSFLRQYITTFLIKEGIRKKLKDNDYS
jgi:hypothetical protein